MLLLAHIAHRVEGQKNDAVHVDKQGIMRWKSNNAEAAFFGVNYTVPFAYSYRAHKALGIDIEKAIQADVYHMARLGLDAFRVHVWDNEISDVQGNLLENDHLRLFDFLLSELKKRNIKTIITPIAFWGNGYPEPDEQVPGFSRFYGRGKLTTNDSAIAAQENYLKQFFSHVNPYTRLRYQEDPDVIAVEINNEPSHSGPKPDVTKYINRLAAAIKNTGWTKPLFYNISQGPFYADAVATSQVDGFSFQWYPSGLVAGHELKGNFLPHVDRYNIPFDTIPAFAKKALMVYEFDAADIMRPCMYPMMAKSFRQAGFQWATQFAYDPMAIAYANTEYQTHYLNLAYTPSKAISLLIASKVFHNVARKKNYGTYPADSTFDVFRVSYLQALSEMNSQEHFYYSNSTQSVPVQMERLQHVAGVGNSPVVKYEGTGTYFLDKLESGIWRLEVMPDAIAIRDPFERASPKKEVTRIEWRPNAMQIALPELGSNFSIQGINDGNSFFSASGASGFTITPGVYLLAANNKKFGGKQEKIGTLGIREFVAPLATRSEMLVRHEPFPEVSAGKSFTIRALAVGLDSGKLSVQVNRMGGESKMFAMVKKSPYEYSAEVPAELVIPGILNYRIIMRKAKEVSVFPGNIKGDPLAWDNFSNETWKTVVANPKGALVLYDPHEDRSISAYPTWRRGFQTSYITGEKPGTVILKLSASDMKGLEMMGFQFSCKEKLRGRTTELSAFDKVMVSARSSGEASKAKVTLVFADASSVSSFITLTGTFQDFKIPLQSFAAGESMLTPRPYPGFQPLIFKSQPEKDIDLSKVERIEMTIIPSDLNKPYSLEVERIWMEKSNKGS